jgi:hypothetical protein
MEALRDIPGFFLALALALLLDCILSAREAPTGPQVRTSVRDKSVRDKHSQVCQVPKNDDRPDGTAFIFFYIILAPYFICRLKYKSKDESKGIDFKSYNNTFGCAKVKRGAHYVCTTEKHSRSDICGDVGSVQRQRERGARHSILTQNCARDMEEKAGRAGTGSGVCHYSSTAGAGGRACRTGAAQVAERCGRNADRQ